MGYGQTCVDAVLRAVQAATVGLNAPVSVSRRADPVTDVDLIINERLRVSLSQIVDVPIVSEEGNRDITEVDTALAWVVDPVDGTHNFVAGLKEYAVSVALVDTATLSATVSACWLPAKDLLYGAVKDAGAHLNGQRMPRLDPEVDRRLVGYGIPAQAYKDAASAAKLVECLMRDGHTLRQSGSAVLDICQVASGTYLGFIERGLMLWDFVAADLIAREVGAASSWSTPSGQWYALNDSFDYAVSSNPEVLSALLHSLAG